MPVSASAANDTKVLIIDDNPDDRESYIRQLKAAAEAHYCCLESADGLKGIDMIKSSEPDCVLLDYSLPGHNGLEILRMIREQYAFMPVILLTGHGNEMVAVQAMKEGADNYFVKSAVALGALHHAIKEVLTQSGLKRELAKKDQQLQAQTNDLSKMVNKLAESNTELERFAYVASHDMQEPLRTIANFSDIILQDYKDKLGAEGHSYLELIRDSAARIQTMVRDLLDYARTEKNIERLTEFDANDELTHIRENIAATIVDKDASITNDYLPRIKGNAVKFSRLLLNLVGNGLKYQAPNVTPHIHISVQDEANDWHFIVSDNGIGIEEKFRQTIFQPFKRLHTWDEYPGTGLGLSLCRNIVESHGGKIWADAAADGNGAAMHFTWPKQAAGDA